MLEADKEITGVTFEYEGSHLALCHKAQGFSANGKPNALLVKGTDAVITDEVKQLAELIKAGDPEVRIETDMVTFLVKWMGLWYDDAEALALLLGYNKEEAEEEKNEYMDYINGKVEGITLLKSKSIPLTAKASDVMKLSEFIKTVGDSVKNSFSEGNSEMNTETVEKSQNPPQKTSDGENQVTDIVELEKAKKDLEARLQELEKAKEASDAALAAMKQEEADRIEKAFGKKVETYTFVSEEERVDVAKALMKDESGLLIDILDKAQAAVDAVKEPQGSDHGNPESVVEKSGVAKRLLAQYGDLKK